MGNPVVALIVPLGEGGLGGIDPGFGNRPIHHPGHPDHGLPSRPDHIGGGPIYHPGHPDHGLPSQPGHPGNRPPGSGSHPGNRPPGSGRPNRPDNALPEGEEIEIDNELPEVPPEYADKTIVAIKKPDEDWRVLAYDPVEIDNALPPAPEPK